MFKKIIIIFAIVFSFVLPHQFTANASDSCVNDSSSIVTGPDAELDDEDEDEDETASSINNCIVHQKDSLHPYTLQGTKARTLRSRTVYIVNGKKRYKN